jgi:hypothetical protein
MPRLKKAVDFTRPETIALLQRASISAGSTSVVDEQNKQTPSSSSFRYLAPGSALKSTQQLPVDWSDFSKHTFFSSAVANVNVAFDSIINNFPFDGTFREVEDFFDELTGFESYVYNQFPKSLNSLMLTGTSYVEVIDAAGSKFPELSKNKTGASVLDPGASSISFQFKLFVPTEPNENQVVAQRVTSNSGYTLAVSRSLSSNVADFFFIYASGSTSIYVTSSINKGEWTDLTAIFNRRPGVNKLQIYVTGSLVTSSNPVSEFEVFTSLSSPLYIGTGSTHSTTGITFEPKNTLSASLDDFKIFVGNRSADDIDLASKNPSEPSPDLRVYFKFNEPSGSYERNSFVIDSSGNGLHSTISNFDSKMRDSTSNTGGPASFLEREAYNPVLFPDYSQLITLNNSLLSQASDYDANNPNFIVKLIPPHYLEEEQSEIGLASVNGDIGREYSDGGNLPRATELGSVQLITSMLLIWAKQFDELKMHIDQMSRLNKVEYSETDGIADTFLPFYAKEYGMELPRLFSDPTYLQYIKGDNLTEVGSIGTNPLYQLEATTWRRILASLPHVIKEKGTIDSVKSIIRSVGIDPEVTLRFKEYGGASSGYIVGRKSTKKSLKFTNTGSHKITSPYLSGTRIEPGLPTIAGNTSDGLFTSSSFTFEGHFLYPIASQGTDSLMRVLSTGSSGESLLLNIILEKSGTIASEAANLTLSGAYSTNSGDPERFSIMLENVTAYDNYPFYVSFGRERESGDTSEWFLRYGRSVGQSLVLTESVLKVVVPASYDNFSNISSAYNSSGSYFQIGPSSIPAVSSPFLNDSSLNSVARTSEFRGRASQLRMWSKYLSGSEWNEHVRNPLSVGVKYPSVNFNFVTQESGSFERLRIDAGLDQPISSSNVSGEISFLDFTQNGLNLSGTNFPTSTIVVSPYEIFYQAINSYFDEASTDEKVRVRSWQERENFEKYGGSNTPVYRVNPSEVPTDDNRFGIEISTVRALNEDMVLMFGGHEAIDELYGNSADLFSEFYTGERHLREIYFNRLTDSVSFKNVFLFSKWFESNIERLVSQLLPYNTEFMGVNLVVESHLLERHKIKYNWADIYLNENDRRALRGTIGLSLITAEVKKI